MNSLTSEITYYLSSISIDFKKLQLDKNTHLITIAEKQLCIITSLVSTSINLKSEIEKIKKVVDEQRKMGLKTFIIWDDLWFQKKEIFKSKIINTMGLNEKIYARQCNTLEISRDEAKIFLDKNHLLSYIKSKLNLGLYHKKKLIAVATFGPIRKMNETSRSTSSELIQFSTVPHTSVIGGLSKLLKTYYSLTHIGDIMTYIPLEWSNGVAFEKIGFKAVSITNPILLKSTANKRQPNSNKPNCYDLGNKKMILSFAK